MVFFIFMAKIIVYILLHDYISSMESDADYYNDFALGYLDVAVNGWPVILRELNNFGLYSRDYISYFLLFLSIFIIPKISIKLAKLNFKKNQKYYLYLFLLCTVYPTLYFLTFDIFRDVFMVTCFLVGCVFVSEFLNSSSFLKSLFYLTMSVLIGILLLSLREYLGYAFLLALCLWKIKFTKNRLIFLGSLYFIGLFFANYLGYLDFLTEYRSGFQEGGAGSTLGLDFSNPLMFFPNFIFSALGQLFGLYITNVLAIILFLFETIPFFFMLIYVIKNIRLADNFVRFLMIFFVIYASVWLIGNDNLGTAVRLRLYNYFAVYISFFYILRLKQLMASKNMQVK